VRAELTTRDRALYVRKEREKKARTKTTSQAGGFIWTPDAKFPVFNFNYETISISSRHDSRSRGTASVLSGGEVEAARFKLVEVSL
jgi:hypothetical protein